MSCSRSSLRLQRKRTGLIRAKEISLSSGLVLKEDAAQRRCFPRGRVDKGAAHQTADVVPFQRQPFESARAAVGCEQDGDGDRQIAASQSNDCLRKAYLAKSAKWRARKDRS